MHFLNFPKKNSVLTELMNFVHKFLFVSVAPTLEYNDKLKEPQILKAASFLSIIVNVRGVPSPSVTWSLNGKQLLSSSHAKIDLKSGSTTLTIQSLKKDDAGKLMVTAENAVGKTSATFDITIRG
jgi:titin